MRKNNKKFGFILLGAIALISILYVTVLRTYVFKLYYKLQFEESIINYSEEFGVDPSLTAAVIFCESGYDPKAKSRVGATGLMQLMPATAEEAASIIHIDGYSEGMLTDPDINIRLGCYYISEMLSEFKNSNNTLAAYNAGPGRTRGWIKTYGVNESGELLYIPYPETEKYVSRVTSVQKVYRSLYPQLVAED